MECQGSDPSGAGPCDYIFMLQFQTQYVNPFRTHRQPVLLHIRSMFRTPFDVIDQWCVLQYVPAALSHTNRIERGCKSHHVT